MEQYGAHYYHRRIIEPKIMNFESFIDFGLYFHQHILFQGLSNYVALSYLYFLDLINVFYSNLQISINGYLINEVDKKKLGSNLLICLNMSSEISRSKVIIVRGTRRPSL